jgi:hypothetical protein
MLTAASHVQQGSTGSLGLIEAHVVDAWGNPAPPENDLEVTLKPAALAADGSGRAAKVSARGSNRSKLHEGVAKFQDVQLKADSDGPFTLVAYCKSRSVVRTRHASGRIWAIQLETTVLVCGEDCTVVSGNGAVSPL